MKKTIAIIRSNPVDPDSRVEKEADALIRGGYNVLLLVWDRNSKKRLFEDEKELPHGRVKRIRFGALAGYGAGMKSLLSFLRFQFNVFWWLIKHKKEYDCCHFCDFDSAFIARKSLIFTKKKYVFDLFDYMSTDAKSIKRKIIKKMEDRTISKASATIICTEQRKLQIKDAKPKKLIVIHNTPMPFSYSPFLSKPSKKNKIVYVGVLDEKQRMLKELIEVVSSLESFELHIGGFGELEAFIADCAKKYDNVFFYGKLQYRDTLCLENDCDIITAIYNPSIGNSLFAAPNKFYEALMLGKPLIMVRGTGMSEIVEENGFGTLIEYDKDSLKKGIENLARKKNEWKTIGANMKKIYEEEYSWKKMESVLLDLYSQIL